MSGIPSAILHEMRSALGESNKFTDQQILAAIFVAEPLAQFKLGLPQAQTIENRIDQTINYLYDKTVLSNEGTKSNVLLLFLKEVALRIPEHSTARSGLDTAINLFEAHLAESMASAPLLFGSLANSEVDPMYTLKTGFLRNDFSLPFINRDTLRRNLFHMTNGDHPRLVMAIDGELEHCGASYSNELIRYFARQQSHRAVYIDLDREWRTGFSPYSLTGLIGKKMRADGIEKIPTQESADVRWNRELADWISEAVFLSESFWWLIIDNFKKIPEFSNEMQDFIQELVEKVNGEDDPQYRFVLIDYNREAHLPLKLRNIPVQENISHRVDKRQDDIRSFFATQLEILRDHLQLSAADVAEILETIPQIVENELSEVAESERPFQLESAIQAAIDMIFKYAGKDVSNEF